MELKLCLSDVFACSTSLLIVPYGIETATILPAAVLVNAFNRTLWN